MLKIKLRNKTLKETPLHDIVDYDDAGGLSNPQPSIAHGQTKSFKMQAQLLWKDTERNWILITPIHFNSFGDPKTGWDKNEHRKLQRDRVAEFIKSKNFSKPSKILVVASTPISGDFETPEWTTGHDIIGHTIADLYNLTTKAYRFQQNLRINNFLPRDEYFDLLYELWKTLPEDLKLDTTATQDGDRSDMVPDILFAIFSRKFNETSAVQKLAETIRQTEDLTNFGFIMAEANASQFVKMFFDSVQNFIASVPDDEPYFIRPF